ncbi:unnamed protein product [Discula destructiva]
MAATTPVRPVPGAFLNTPAPAPDPVRRHLFGAAGSRRGPLGTSPPQQPAINRFHPPGGRPASPPPPAGPPAPPAAQPTIENENTPPSQRAARFVNDLLQLDGSFPDLDSYCRPGASSDYDLALVDPAWAPFHKAAIYRVPEQVFAQFENSQVHTDMGLFPEIHLAYVHVDNALYLWDYTLAEPELFGFEDSPHRITAVALVPPRPNVFVDNIKHMLVVATATEMILLGLSQEPAPAPPRIFQTRMSVHKGSTDVSFIVASADGRVFFGGKTDTDVQELYYQQEERWFSSRVGKINHTHPGWSSALPNVPSPLSLVPYSTALWATKATEGLAGMAIDDSRKLLYTLSTSSTIRTYQIEGPDKLTKCIEKDKLSCLRDITHMITRSDLLTNDMNIVSISPILANEASKLHLMALTDTGCRIFLSATSSSYYYSPTVSNAAPQSMQVQFVKFPPSDAQTGYRPRGMDGAEILDPSSNSLTISRLGRRFAPGYFFDAVRKNDKPQTDRVFVSAPETGRIRLAGTTPGAPLRYHEQANWIEFDEGEVLAIGAVTPPFAAAGQPMGFGNELAVQFDQPAPEFAIMTNQGIHVLRRRRMVDIFATVIRKAAGEEGITEEVRRFIHLYGRQETISTALAVACGQGNDLRNGAPRVVDQVTQDRARSTFVGFGGQPMVADTDGQTVNADSVKLSYRYHAIGSYMTRLIRRLWKARVIVQGLDGQAVIVQSTIPMAKLKSTQESLDRLRNFLNANRGMIQGLSGPQDLAHVRNRHEEIAIQAEHQGLHALQKLMEGIAEGISFVLMLFDERVSDIFVRLDAATQNEFRELSYEQLFSHAAGRELAKVLVKAIVNRNIESGANVETVAEALRRRCGSFCSPEDVVIFKAQEHLKKASEQVANPNVVRQLLGDSLHLFEQVASSLTFTNLQGAVQRYVQLQYYAGAIQLCLRVAREKDRGNSALGWVKDDKPVNDPREAAFLERQRCYEMVHDVLMDLDAVAGQEPDMVDGRPTLMATKRMEAYQVVNGADDEVFHYDLYDWYIARGLTDRLLSVESPHVITYLTKLAQVDLEHAHLLCSFYTTRSRFYEAAEVQAALAKNRDFDISLQDRVSLLGHAKANSSVSTMGVSQQHQQILSHNVTVLLEVGHIQDDLLGRLLADTRIPVERKVAAEERLNGPILELTELWNGYAEPAEYHDISLIIIHVADHYNPRLVADTWRMLLDSAHAEVLQQLAAWEAAGRPEKDPNIVQPPLPYEHVMSRVTDVAHRTSLNDHIFPIDVVLTLLCRYSIENGQDETIGADPSWPVLLFLSLNIPHASIARVLERILDAQEAPFTSRRRKVVVRWLNEVLARWVRNVETQGTAGGLGQWVADLLERCQEAIQEVVRAEERATRTVSTDTQTVHAQVRELQDWVQGVLDGRGAPASRLF